MKHILYFEPDPFFEHEMSVEIADDLVLRGIVRPIPRTPNIQGYLPTDDYRHLDQKQLTALADGVEIADSALNPLATDRDSHRASWTRAARSSALAGDLAGTIRCLDAATEGDALFPADDFLDDDELGNAIDGLTLLIAGLRRDGRNDETAESARRKLAIHRKSRRSLRLGR